MAQRATAATLAVVGTLAAIMLGVTSPISDWDAAPPPRPYLGIAYGNTLIGMDDARLAGTLDDAVGTGVTTARIDLDWNDVQPDSAKDFTWDRADRVIAAIRSRGLSLIVVLAYTPIWARPPGCTSEMCPPADPARFADFAGAAAQHYGSHSILAWEIWNEPNTPGSWEPAVDPPAYAQLLVAATRAVLATNQTATVLLGGLACVDGTDGAVTAPDFLEKVAGLGAVAGIGGVAFHPYTFPYLASESRTGSGPWSQIDNTSDSLRAVLQRHHAADMPIWLTEYGAPTGGPGPASDGSSPVPPDSTHVTEAQQARIADDAVRTVAADTGIAALIWYSDRDLSADTSTNLNSYGLRRADGSAKPALGAFRAAVGSLVHRQTTA